MDFSNDYARDFVTEEKVNALYIQNTYTWDKGVIVAGVRYEDTSTESQAFDQDEIKFLREVIIHFLHQVLISSIS